MNENAARVQEFRNEVEGLKLKGSSSEGERRLLVIGVLLAVVGVGLAVLGAVQVGATGDSPADQRAYMAQGSFMGLALIIAGAALFVRYSIARYLRFWLIRMTYESRSNTDRIVDAIERAGGLPSSFGAQQNSLAADPPAAPAPHTEPTGAPSAGA